MMMYGRTYMGIIRSTFIIYEDGTNSKAFPKARVKGHSEQVLATLAN
jgi:peroxiredoxin Q/BCP